MKNFIVSLLAILVWLPVAATAFYDMDNFWTTAHEAPAWFEADGTGGYYGATVAGTAFSQHPIFANSGVRLHKFAIGEAFFYISDRGVIRANNDLHALSIYFTLG
jgi:hypothetical protein